MPTDFKYSVSPQNRLVLESSGNVLFVPPHAANWSSRKIQPDVIVIHFTAGGPASGSVKWFQMGPDERAKAGGSRSQSSAHVVVDRDGSIVQMVPFDCVAFHAGDGTFQGKAGVNQRSLGIEIANWGAVSKAPTGDGFLSWSGAKIPKARVAKGEHKLPQYRGKSWEYWEIFPEEQIKSVIALCRALKAAYPGLVFLVGHDDVAPKRKNDPGPLWPMERLRAEVLP